MYIVQIQRKPPIYPEKCIPDHRCKKHFLRFLLFFYKISFLTFFIFWNVFYFLMEKCFIYTKPGKILLNLLNSCIKQLLSDGLNMAAITKFSHQQPQPSNVVMHAKTVILLGDFSFGLINFVNLSTTSFIQRFVTFLIFS